MGKIPPKRSALFDGFSLALLLLLALAFLQTLRPFLLDIVIAVILVDFFWSINTDLTSHLKGRAKIASLISVLVLFLSLASVFFLVFMLLRLEVMGGLEALSQRLPQLSEQLSALNLADRLGHFPLIGSLVRQFDPTSVTQWIEQAANALSAFLVETARRSFTTVGLALAHLVLILLLMYSLFIDGGKLAARVKELLPLSDASTEEFTHEISSMTRAALISTLVIGVIEGIYAGLLFVIFGLPSPLLWGLLTVVISIIPVVGANVIIAPAGVLMMIAGRPVAGLILIVLGFAGIAVTQNLLRPRLLGGKAGLHPALVLLTTLGGIAWLGIVGFLVGPLIASLFLAAVRQFSKRYRRQLDEGSLSA